MSTESNKRKDAPDTTELPVCKKFCAANADIVLKSTKRDADPDTGSSARPVTLFRVHSEDLKRMSVVFRDMLELGDNAHPGEGNVIELPEDSWVLEKLLLLNNTDIDALPDLHSRYVLSLLRLHEAAAKYAMAGTQVLLESEIRYVYCDIVQAGRLMFADAFTPDTSFRRQSLHMRHGYMRTPSYTIEQSSQQLRKSACCSILLRLGRCSRQTAPSVAHLWSL